MKITLFGCKDTTLHTAKFLKKFGVSIDLITISSTTSKSNQVAGYIDLSDYQEYFSSIYIAKNYTLQSKQDEDHFITRVDTKLGFCIGWQRLIPEAVLNFFETGVYGMHGSARNLPFGKGRSPMNWAILEGRKWFHTNLFKYQLGIDDGPIIDTYTFSISSNDTAETLHYKNTIAMCHLIQKNLNAIIDGTVDLQKQDSAYGESFYPKRIPEDGIIDWRDDIFNIERLIRAVAHPFYGAFTFMNGDELIINRGNVFYTDLEQHPFLLANFGEVVDVFPSGKFLVRCSGGVLLTHEYKGKTPLKGSNFDTHDSSLQKFLRNPYGFFDV